MYKETAAVQKMREQMERTAQEKKEKIKLARENEKKGKVLTKEQSDARTKSGMGGNSGDTRDETIASAAEEKKAAQRAKAEQKANEKDQKTRDKNGLTDQEKKDARSGYEVIRPKPVPAKTGCNPKSTIAVCIKVSHPLGKIGCTLINTAKCF